MTSPFAPGARKATGLAGFRAATCCGSSACRHRLSRAGPHESCHPRGRRADRGAVVLEGIPALALLFPAGRLPAAGSRAVARAEPELPVQFQWRPSEAWRPGGVLADDPALAVRLAARLHRDHRGTGGGRRPDAAAASHPVRQPPGDPDPADHLPVHAPDAGGAVVLDHGDGLAAVAADDAGGDLFPPQVRPLWPRRACRGRSSLARCRPALRRAGRPGAASPLRPHVGISSPWPLAGRGQADPPELPASLD